MGRNVKQTPNTSIKGGITSHSMPCDVDAHGNSRGNHRWNPWDLSALSWNFPREASPWEIPKCPAGCQVAINRKPWNPAGIRGTSPRIPWDHVMESCVMLRETVGLIEMFHRIPLEEISRELLQDPT